MNKELVARLAREADFEVLSNGDVLSLAQDENITQRLARFAALVAEACAKVCADEVLSHSYDEDQRTIGHECAAAIRAKFRGMP